MKTMKEIAPLIGVSRNALQKRVKKLFPDISRQEKTIYLTDEQAAALKNYREIRAQTDKISVKELADKLRCTRQSIRRRIQERYPGLMVSGRRVLLSLEQAECIAKMPRKKPGIKSGYKYKPGSRPASRNPKSDAVKKTAETPGKAGPKEAYFGPSAEELKKIQAEEAARKAASFRKWLERKKKAGGTAWKENRKNRQIPPGK